MVGLAAALSRMVGFGVATLCDWGGGVLLARNGVEELCCCCIKFMP